MGFALLSPGKRDFVHREGLIIKFRHWEWAGTEI